MARGYWAYIQPVDRQSGRPGGGPVDPGWGVDEGEGPIDPGFGWGGGERPSHGLPRPPRPGRPVDPDWGWGGSEHPDQGLPGRPGRPVRPGQRPPHVWPKPPGGGLPVDPDWGVGGAEHPDHGLPVYPMDPAHPDNTLPPVDGEEPPPVDPPPGTVWPPLPPEFPGGKAIVLAGITGVGYRYIVVDIPPPKPDQGVPPPVAQPKRGIR
jgi:hypothetical protein